MTVLRTATLMLVTAIAAACASDQSLSPVAETEAVTQIHQLQNLNGCVYSGGLFFDPDEVTIPVGARDTVNVSGWVSALDWTEDNSNVAFGIGWGVIVATGLGSTCVYAEDDAGNTGAVEVHVVSPVLSSVTISPSGVTVIKGLTANLSAVGHEQQNNPMSGVSISLSSTVPSVATVSSSGLVSTHAAGQAKIIATSAGFADTTFVTVRPGTPSIQGSTVADPPYPTPRAQVSWSATPGATSYKIYRRCKMSDGYTSDWEFWDTSSSAGYLSWDYVESYEGGSPPSSAYIGYYVVASGGGIDSPISNKVYFEWDDVAEPGC